MVKNSYEEASSKGHHSHVTLLDMMSRCPKYVKDFSIFSETLLELILKILATSLCLLSGQGWQTLVSLSTIVYTSTIQGVYSEFFIVQSF